MAKAKAVSVGSIGELLVEFVCQQQDGHHREVASYSGPFPSGAPGIFISQAALVGARAIFVGAVGRDAFGDVLLRRLEADKVDLRLVSEVPGLPTGSAFVSYNQDGSRDFVFNIAHSAASQFTEEAGVIASLRAFGLDIMHVSGSSLSDPAMARAILAICEALHEQGTQISFDPNIRKELAGDPVYLASVKRLISICTYFLPSEEDATVLFPGMEFDAYAATLFDSGVRYLVLKRGAQGCRGAESGGAREEIDGHRVAVLDPTGAGDCFCATFVTLMGSGDHDFRAALERANAAGAMAVTKVGPMEGNSRLSEVEHFISDTANTRRGGLQYLRQVVADNRRSAKSGIPSYCTANADVLRAVIRSYSGDSDPILIEATCNQVNQFGGYTGMNAADFRIFVRNIAAGASVDPDRIILGGDHLGPNPWKGEPAQVAMAKARDMVRSYVAAGFTKLHLDASMPCVDDVALGQAEMSRRAAELCAVAEEAAGSRELVYVVGTEVPIAGGEKQAVDSVAVTTPSAVEATIEFHRQAFRAKGIEAALDRIIGIVVQPGVDFGNNQIIGFDRKKAVELAALVGQLPGMAFEAHSTDYQSVEALSDLVACHFAILKVGPELTLAYREALVAMSHIEEWHFDRGRSDLLSITRRTMERDPRHWADYVGADDALGAAKIFGLSDRIRYYWPFPEVADAIALLRSNIDRISPDAGMLAQYLGNIEGLNMPMNLSRSELIIQAKVGAVVGRFRKACGRGTG